jgi:hypothetical protein
MNNNSNENLRNKINHHQASINHMHRQGFSANYIARTTPYHEAQIRALQRELNRRVKAKAQARWKKVRGHVGARGIVGYLQRLSMMPPTRGGAGYLRLMRQTGIGRPSTRNVGTSTSPRRSPRRRSPSRSRSPRRRTPNKRSPGRSPRR